MAFRRSPIKFSRSLSPLNAVGPSHYSSDPKIRGGQDMNIKMTEVFDGFTDDFGVFKEGPPATLRLEYLRQPHHLHQNTTNEKHFWSPFEVPDDMRTWSPIYYDGTSTSGRDYWGHRALPGRHYRRDEFRACEHRYQVNDHPQMRIPKWLAGAVHDQRGKRILGFFLYSNGAYCAELLTYKQLPRLAYNKPFQGFMPTIGQTVDLSEVTYGKEIHSVEKYPGYGASIAKANGTAAVVLRGSEPNLVPLLLPSREIRLFDSAAHAVFGRRAGLMYKNVRYELHETVHKWIPKRPQVASQSWSVSDHPQGGGNGAKTSRPFKVDWKWEPITNLKSRYYLNAYVIRGHEYVKHSSTSDLKSKTYSWASRDPIYR